MACSISELVVESSLQMTQKIPNTNCYGSKHVEVDQQDIFLTPRDYNIAKIKVQMNPDKPALLDETVRLDKAPAATATQGERRKSEFDLESAYEDFVVNSLQQPTNDQPKTNAASNAAAHQGPAAVKYLGSIGEMSEKSGNGPSDPVLAEDPDDTFGL